MAPTPQALLGDPITGQGSDSLAGLVNKYNAHSHGQVFSQSFLDLGAVYTWLVTVKEDDAFQYIPNGTYVVSVSDSNLGLSQAALKSGTVTLILTHPQNVVPAVEVPVTLTGGSLNVAPNPQNGELSSSVLNNLKQVVAPLTLYPLVETTIPCILNLPFDCWFKSLSVICYGGSASFTLERTTSIPLLSAVDFNKQTFTWGAQSLNNSSFYNAGEDIRISVSNLVTESTVTGYLTFVLQQI